MKNLLTHLGVCSWSLGPASPEELIRQTHAIGIPRLQLALDPVRRQPEVWGAVARQCAEAGISLVSGMFGTVGEDYSSLESIRRTGGVLPDETWDQNWENIQANAELAASMHLRLVTFHAGFIPHDTADPGHAKMLHRLRLIADVFAAKKIDLALETGQETAATLRDFLHQLGRVSLGVNFDPANMILYDKGDPIEALEILLPFLKQVHLKDGLRTTTPGAWGREVVVGTGQVKWREFFQILEKANFSGYCCIEREAGPERLRDIASARKFVTQFVG